MTKLLKTHVLDCRTIASLVKPWTISCSFSVSHMLCMTLFRANHGHCWISFSAVYEAGKTPVFTCTKNICLFTLGSFFFFFFTRYMQTCSMWRETGYPRCPTERIHRKRWTVFTLSLQEAGCTVYDGTRGPRVPLKFVCVVLSGSAAP